MNVRIIQGDALACLRELPADSVHCCVTSPPYWGLRDYGVEGQIGLEASPDAWAARLVEVFREVRRVLRPDGTCWVNVGDSYCANVGRGFQPNGGQQRGTLGNRNPFTHPTKPKDLVGQPWLLAFALRADGWFLRSEIIWAKPNPMPESVTDRPTKAHEQIFLLTKSARYFWDQEAVRERAEYGRQNHHSAWVSGTVNGDGHRSGGGGRAERNSETGRNLHSVWTIATEAFPDAHFATFPTELARRCILAGTSAKGCCPECGAPWARTTEHEYVKRPGFGANSVVGRHVASGQNNFDGAGMPRLDKSVTTTGWRPTCACDAGAPVPCTVLDSFGGSGTVGVVADQLDRAAILIELSQDYVAMAERRIARARSDRVLGKHTSVPVLLGQLRLDLEGRP